MAKHLPEISLKLDGWRVAWGRDAPVYEEADSNSGIIGHLKTAATVVSIGEVKTESGENWLRVAHKIIGIGYMLKIDLRPHSEDSFRAASFDLVRSPRTVWPEPPRRFGSQADTTFTITFNGRIGSFFEAMGSVLTGLDHDELATIEHWIVVCDRGADPDHRDEVQRAMPWATFIGKGRALHGHPKSMNLLLRLVDSKYWLNWEDDWAMTRSGGAARGLLCRAKDVIRNGMHQVALNGAWLESDAAWGSIGHSSHLTRRRTIMGTDFCELVYPAESAARVKRGKESIWSLVDGYSAGTNPKGGAPHNAKPLLWPMYSNQPSLNDAGFMKALLPFDERPEYNRDGAYWYAPQLSGALPGRKWWSPAPQHARGRFDLLTATCSRHRRRRMWEFEFGLKFVRADGRKATLPGPGLARQVATSSSSGAGVRQKVEYDPPTRLNVPVPPPSDLPSASTAAVDTVEPSAPPRRSKTEAIYVALALELSQRGGNLDELISLAARDRAALREQLQTLGIRKIGERLKFEHAVMMRVDSAATAAQGRRGGCD